MRISLSPCRNARVKRFLLSLYAGACMSFALHGCAGSHAVPAISPASTSLAQETATNASSEGHLYVSGLRTNQAFVISRFPIINGVVRTYPDLTYPPESESTTIAVDSAGRVYAWNFDQPNTASVRRFAPGGTLLDTLDVIPPSGYRFSDQAYLTVDNSGLLYVALTFRQYPCVRGCKEYAVVRVYAADASGAAKPLRVIGLRGCLGSVFVSCAGFPQGLVIDAQGELIVALREVLYVVASPRTVPHITHTFSLADVTEMLTIAIDSTNELYVSNGGASTSHIDALHRTTSGTWQLDRVISLSNPQIAQLLYGLAAGNHRLFAGTNEATSDPIFELSSDRAGPQSPIVQIPFYLPWDIKLGV